jgi:pimeloyl-ACP methyl ester carboxylesterase
MTTSRSEAEARLEAEIFPEIHDVPNGAGWSISLKRVAPTAPAPDGRARRPVLIVPGYGMNSFIFSFHPRGLSLEEYLASRGLEVWSVDLRSQGRSTRRGGSDEYGLAELGIDDVGVAVKHVLSATRTGHDKLDLIGCSLGTALVFAYLACVEDPPVGSVVNLGGLVTWVKVHPALLAAAYSPRLIGMIKVRHTRKLARLALPALARFLPKVLSLYLNTASTDTSNVATMVKTVEDPNPFVNREIAEWITRRELVVRGVNVSRALRSMTNPFLCVIANNDGIVPPETARDPYDAIGSADKELLAVGDVGRPIAHADLFLSTGAQESVFTVITRFLLARS